MVDFASIPLSTIIVTGTAVGLNLISNVATRLLTDVERARRIRAEVKAFRKELRQAIVTKNKAKEEKLRKKEKQMTSLEMKVSMQRMKPLLFFWIPFILIYYLLVMLLEPAGGINAIVAISPVQIPVLNIGVPLPEGGYGFNLFWWYLISSLSFSSISMKLLGTGMD
ncbi:MAG: DUF106 domain-containing protein [Nitrososphaerales archaeon]|nr:DUF106 domain-containing protein [Nitrososphaerales archaeon]